MNRIKARCLYACNYLFTVGECYDFEMLREFISYECYLEMLYEYSAIRPLAEKSKALIIEGLEHIIAVFEVIDNDVPSDS